MTRTKRLFWATLTLAAALAAGCVADVRTATARELACPPADLEITDRRTNPGGTTWRARCVDRAYTCVADREGTTCTPVDETDE